MYFFSDFVFFFPIMKIFCYNLVSYKIILGLALTLNRYTLAILCIIVWQASPPTHHVYQQTNKGGKKKEYYEQET